MRATLMVLALAFACASEPDPVLPDARAPVPDAAGDVTCDPSRLENVVERREILEGDFCDDLQLCAAGAEQAEAIVEIAPGFSCEASAGCEPGQIACQWFDPDVLDAAEYGQLCAITSLDDPPRVRCLVYL